MSTSGERVERGGTWLLALAFLSLSLWADLDLLGVRSELFMDEWVSFDEVGRLLHATTPFEVVQGLLAGADNRYGRVFFDLLALVSWLPHRLGGDAGQMLATRLWGAGLLLVAYLVLVRSFLTRPWSRLLALAACLFLPHTAYFAHMPKPEPLQLVFLALFLRGASARGYRGGRHWGWLGLALATKISVAPLVPLFLVPLLLVTFGLRIPGSDAPGGGGPESSPGPQASEESALGLPRSLFWLTAGFLLGEPIFLLGGGSRWLAWILGNTTHGADVASVGPVAWLAFLVGGWGPLPPLLMTGTLAAGVVCWGAWLSRGRDAWLGRGADAQALVLSGLALTLPIMLRVQRLWGHYLHLGAVLLVVGGLLLLERLDGDDPGPVGSLLPARPWVRGVTGGLLLQALVFGVPASLAQYRELASRTRAPEFLLRRRERRAVEGLLGRLRGSREEALLVLCSPHLHPPEEVPGQRVELFWGPFRAWGREAEVVLLHDAPEPPGSRAEHGALEFRRERERHLVKAGGGSCEAPPCYRRFPAEDPRTWVLVRWDLDPGEEHP